jgi:hypothetical protein
VTTFKRCVVPMDLRALAKCSDVSAFWYLHSPADVTSSVAMATALQRAWSLCAVTKETQSRPSVVFSEQWPYVKRCLELTDRLCRCGGGLEYLDRSPASRKRRRKGNPVLGGITGPSCSWGI